MVTLVQLVRAMRGDASRSTVLAPLLRLVMLVAVALIGVVLYKPTTPYVEAACFILFGLVVLFTCVMYVYFAIKNPEQLRSERHVIEMLAIERGLSGDNLRGIRSAAAILTSEGTDAKVTPEKPKELKS